MDSMETILFKLTIPTCDINTELLQEILSSSRKIFKSHEIIDDIIHKLWEHMSAKLSEFDDQLLCCTCFYTLLTFSEKQDEYLMEIFNILNDTLLLEQSKTIYKEKLLYAMTLMYGFFQSSYLTQKYKVCNDILTRILEVTFHILIAKAYEYSQYTYIAFKTISSFKKVIGTNFQSKLFCRNKQIQLLNVINHNWENPITGVRNLNRSIFQTLISVLDKDIFHGVIEEINTFYWNKAKFLMLTEIIEQTHCTMSTMMRKNNWIDGLMYSLHKPGLVSCGSDMYYAILKKTKTDEEWCNIFLKPLLNILGRDCYKAIENFYNYWCLTTLKKFPSLLDTLLNELLVIRDIETKLFSSLSVMKQGNKIALLKKIEHMEVIMKGLVHVNPQIRIRSFDIVCISHGKCLPDVQQYQTVIEFLSNNINSDCTVLRINMINSFSSFLTYLHNAFLINEQPDSLSDLKTFCLNLQYFLTTSINLNGNYQRKITTVKLIDVTFKYMNSIPSKKHSRRVTRTLTDMLKADKIWILSQKEFTMKLLNLLKDPADDIRQGILDVLLNYYSNDLKHSDTFTNILQDVKQCSGSKFFYDIDCSKIMFKLMVCIILKGEEVEHKNVEVYFQHWYDQLVYEHNLERNIVDSIHEGKQMHSILGLLLVIFESCLEYGYRLDIPRETIWNICSVLEDISKQFISDENSTVSYDFSKMSELVESLIRKSNTTLKDQYDETNISGLHQNVLSCLWLNVKMSCDLSAILIEYNAADETICSKCLNTITHVLETCRHKGAIEAAGTALGKSIQYLTSLTGSDVSNLPFNLLERKLEELIGEANKMASVTRRGAGLSIMVHRIVSSDMKKGKPLFHYFINIMLKTCTSFNGTANEDSCSSENDLPKAIYIHFLTKIVTDSCLASEMMYYSASLAELAFGNLTSPHWQIRNASLQLYGALIPKLIGQKKASGQDEETVATVACDEFKTHSPKLWKYILDQIENIDNADFIQSHSDLVPILNILANVARRYNFKYNHENISDQSKLLYNLKILLGSPIYTVRRLVASCILNLYSFQEISHLLLDSIDVSENAIHGVLMLLEGFTKIYKVLMTDEIILKMEDKYKMILSCKPYSYLSKSIFQKLFPNRGIQRQSIQEVYLEAQRNRYIPGVFVWANVNIINFIQNATWVEVAENLQTILCFDDFEIHSEIICNKIDNSLEVSEELLYDIAKGLLSAHLSIRCQGLWKVLYRISLKAELKSLVDNESFKQQISNLEYRNRYFIPFASRILDDEEGLLKISNVIYWLCHPDTTDTDMRYIASLANNELATKFFNLPETVKIICIKSAVILLQDEDEDIRNLSTNFYFNLKKESSRYHANICLQNILSVEFMNSVLKYPQETKSIVKDLHQFISSTISSTRDAYNPFANDSKNIYLEPNILKTLLNKLSEKYE